MSTTKTTTSTNLETTNTKFTSILPFPKNVSTISNTQQQPKEPQKQVFSELLHMALNGNPKDSSTKKRKERNDDGDNDNSDDDSEQSENGNDDDDDIDDKYHTENGFLENKIVISVRKYNFYGIFKL